MSRPSGWNTLGVGGRHGRTGADDPGQALRWHPPREEASKTLAGYGTGSPCAGCDLAIHPTDVEHAMVFADKRSFAFHLACVTLWHALKDAPADGEWRVTCSCKERIGFADTFAAAEALGREHVAARRNAIRKGRHVITLALDQDDPR
jgi:hypothetical protein